MELALYHPEVGYYRRDLPRVGYGRGTDFYTSAQCGQVFGELVSAACLSLLDGRNPQEHTFVEIGAEPGRSVLAKVEHPFAGVRTLRVGDPLRISGPCVVFSNELFDAQPCVRTVFRRGRWHETGVRIDGSQLREVEWHYAEHGLAPEGYRFDRPFAAARLAGEIAAQPWWGLFVAIDYGKTLEELARHTPGGTVRAYSRHVVSDQLLERPGLQDLTCHVCWDWMIAALSEQGFTHSQLEFQESFFVRHATRAVARISADAATTLNRQKLALMQLIHPSQMGQKFQVLHALK